MVEISSVSMIAVIAIGVLVLLVIVWWLVKLVRRTGGSTGCANGCSAASSLRGEIKRSVDASGQERITLPVGNMHCANCERSVTMALTSMEGVRNVRASYTTGTVSFLCDGREETLTAISKRLKEMGFPVLS